MDDAFVLYMANFGNKDVYCIKCEASSPVELWNVTSTALTCPVCSYVYKLQGMPYSQVVMEGPNEVRI